MKDDNYNVWRDAFDYHDEDFDGDVDLEDVDIADRQFNELQDILYPKTSFNNDEEEEFEDDEDTEELYSVSKYSSTLPVAEATKANTPKSQVEQESYIQEMRENEETAEMTRDEENKKTKKYGNIFIAVFFIFLGIGALFETIGGTVCEIIGDIFLWIDLMVVVFIVTCLYIGNKM
jgi:cation transport ATPase